MRRVVILLFVLLPAWPAVGEEKAGTTCDLQALLDPDDAGLLVAYDGLRKGLEIARLPRVCRHDPAPDTGGVAGFLERRAMAAAPLRENGKRIEPFFAIGDASCAAVQKAGTSLPCVMAVTRYTVKRKPLVPLPRASRGSVVYADIPVERLASLVRDIYGERRRAEADTGAAPHLVMFQRGTAHLEPSYRMFARHYPKVVFGSQVDGVLQLPEEELHGGAPLLMALLQVGPTVRPVEFAAALKLSKKRKLPLVSDNRAHFGLGAVVVIVPRHDLLGKAAADEGRKLRAGGTPRKEPRAVPGFEVWVDLAAADAIGFELPLAFLARADRIKRARRPAPGAAR